MAANLTTQALQAVKNGLSYKTLSYKKASAEEKIHFLAVLADTYSVYHASVAIGIHRRTALEWRAADPDFALAWDDVLIGCGNQLQGSAFQRALSGKSDLLTIFLLKGIFPELYKENTGLDFRGASIKIEYVEDWRQQGAISDGEG